MVMPLRSAAILNLLVSGEDVERPEGCVQGECEGEYAEGCVNEYGRSCGSV